MKDMKLVTSKEITTTVELSKKEILVQFLLNNYMDEKGNINISDLDFGEFEGAVIITGIKSKGDVFQYWHKNGGDVIQWGHENLGDIAQSKHENAGDIEQYEHKNKGHIDQSNHENNGKIIA